MRSFAIDVDVDEASKPLTPKQLEVARLAVARPAQRADRQ
jgi:hypothetical protein